jgi:hypothetical protein
MGFVASGEVLDTGESQQVAGVFLVGMLIFGHVVHLRVRARRIRNAPKIRGFYLGGA